MNNGCLKLLINNTVYDVCEGDLIVIPPNKLHRYLADERRELSLIGLSLFAEIQEKLVHSEMLDFWNEASEKPVLHPKDDEQRWISTLLMRLMKEKRNPDEDEMIQLSLIDLLIQEIRRFYLETEVPVDKSSFNQSDVSRLVKNIIYYIEENYTQKISLAQIAQELWLNPSYISRTFKQNTGLTITEFIAARRIRCAELLLMDEGKSVSEVAMSCGFNNISYFNSVFKNTTGFTPGEYRRHQASRLQKKNCLPIKN